MHLAKIKTPQGIPGVAIVEGNRVRPLQLNGSGYSTLSDLLFSGNAKTLALKLVSDEAYSISDVKILAPVDQQEVWAAGVTYKRSQVARMEESESAASHYDKVYSADRPELFFKGTAARMVHPGEPVRVRIDSEWSVPEPEFTLVLDPNMQIVGYTIGNDMSARDIEGENPLYLPQAKVYKQCCSLGPYVWIPDEELDLANTHVNLSIVRDQQEVFAGETTLDQLHRKLTDLAKWLGKENEFPHGAMLLTGTGVVPDDDFTLENDDAVTISITNIGTLQNPVVKG